MTSFYFCETCDTIIAGDYGARAHRDARHSLTSLTSIDDLRKYGISRDPDNATSSTNKAGLINIGGVRKSVAYIGKSGKEVKVRREGSYVAVTYRHVDSNSGVSASLSEQDYYKLLFANGIPSADVLHTFNSKQNGSAAFQKRILSNSNPVVLVTTHSDNPSALQFALSSEYGINGYELANPYAFLGRNNHSLYTHNVTEEQAKYFRLLHNQESVIYYDILAPRALDSAEPAYLTRVLMTIMHNDYAVEKLKAQRTRKLMLYEMSKAELSEIYTTYTSTSFDWASRIVQDARDILCS